MTTPKRTDLGNAQRLVDQYADRIRWVPERTDWLVWNGNYWRADAGRGQVIQFAAGVARDLWKRAGDEPDEAGRKVAAAWAAASESRSRIEAMVALARSDPRVVVSQVDLDPDPWLFGCANGTVDLRTGQLLVPDPAHLITKSTHVEYNRGATSDVFDAFLTEVQPDPEMRAYLARLLGHALVGEVTEHILPIWHGDGSNGKGTLKEIVLHVMGDYGSAIAVDLLLVKDKGGDHPTGIADLAGQRLVIASESERTKRMNEAVIKELTGGDTLKARFLFRDFFQFTPSHSVVLVTNHPPVVAGTDYGIWRRLRLVPWSVEIGPERVNVGLPAELRADAQAILAWLVAGCLDWQKQGLAEPAAVTDATGDYRADSDTLGRFIAERCQTGGSLLKVSSSVFRGAYLGWCAEESEEPFDTKTVAVRLRSLGCKPYRSKNFRGWSGLALLTDRSEGDG